MGGLSGDAAGHLLPVVEVVALLIGGIVTIIGVGWSGFRWLRSQIRESFENFTTGPEFRRVVSGIISDATAGWNDVQNRLHEEHRRGIAELRERDVERADSVKRAHQRIDGMMERTK